MPAAEPWRYWKRTTQEWSSNSNLSSTCIQPPKCLRRTCCSKNREKQQQLGIPLIARPLGLSERFRSRSAERHFARPLVQGPLRLCQCSWAALAGTNIAWQATPKYFRWLWVAHPKIKTSKIFEIKPSLVEIKFIMWNVYFRCIFGSSRVKPTKNPINRLVLPMVWFKDPVWGDVQG